MVGALDKQRVNTRRARSGFRLMMVFAAAAAIVVSGCGDDRLFRNFTEQSAQPGTPLADADAGTGSDTGPATAEELQAWYDSQDEIIAPWARELDDAAIADAIVEDDRVSWPLPEYEYMKEWDKHDILWSPVSDPSRAFLRRVLDMAVTDTHIIFQTRSAGLDEVYFKSRVEVDTTRQQLNSTGRGQDGQSRTRGQELKKEVNNIEFQFALPKKRFGACRKAGSGIDGFVACAATDPVCIPDPEDTRNLCEEVDPDAATEDDSGIQSEPMSAEVSFGTYIEFVPQLQFNFYRVYLVADFNGWGDEDSRPCNCITRYYDDDINQVARACGMSADDVVGWKAECSGATVFANLEIAGGASLELKDLTWNINKETTFSKEFTLFKSLPIPLGGGIGVTMDVTVPITFNLKTLGELHWKNAPNGPKFGFDFGFGYINPAGPNGQLYRLNTPDENATSIPAPQVSIRGESSLVTEFKVGALIGFAGSVGAKLTIGAKADAGVSAGVDIETSNGNAQGVCEPYFKLGGTLAASLMADLGVWEKEKTWPIFDTCADPNSNLFNLDMRAACLSWGGNNLCNNVWGNQVRLVARDVNEGGTAITATGDRVDPAGIEVDAIHAVRGSGSDARTIKATSVQSGGTGGQSIGDVNFDQCTHGSNWASKVTTFQNEMIVTFDEPLQPGDKLRVFRQGFPLSMGGRDADGNVVYCRPSGTFDVYVGNDGQWGQAAAGEMLKPEQNVHDLDLALRHFPE